MKKIVFSVCKYSCFFPEFKMQTKPSAASVSIDKVIKMEKIVMMGKKYHPGRTLHFAYVVFQY